MSAQRVSLVRNVTASWLTHAASLAIGFFLMPFVLHTLGDSAYGTWVFITAIASNAGLLYLGFGDTIGRYVAQYQSRREWDRLNEVVTLIVTIYSSMALLALAVAALLALFAPSLHDWTRTELFEVRIVILLLGLTVATGLAGSAFGGVLVGMRRFDVERGIAFAGDLLRLALLVLFLKRESGLIIIAAVFLAMTIVDNLAIVWWAFRLVPQLSIRPRYLKWSVLRECLHFSGFALLNSIAYQLIYATDTVVIGCVFGAAAVVPYQIALRLCQMLRQPITKIAEICMPTAGALHAQSDRGTLQRMVVKAMGVSFLLAAGLFTGIYFFGDQLIASWVGDEYADSQLLLLVLFGGQLIALPVGVLRSTLFGMGAVRGPALVYLAEAVCNVVLSLILCQPLGVFGVALGTVIPIFVFEAGVLLPYGLKRIGLSPWPMFRDTVVPQLLPLTALIAYAMSVDATTTSHADWFSLAAITLGGGVALATGWLAHSAVQRHLDLPPP